MKRVLLGIILAILTDLPAKVTVPAIFSDHAVLAKRSDVPVFGSADPGEKVILSFAGKSASVTAGSDGRWMIKLDLTDVSAGPHLLKINELVFKDILVGEVFLASGQSNMAFRLNRVEGYDAERARPANLSLRFFNVAPDSQKEPVSSLRGQWEVCTPESVGRASAVGYFFAQKLQEALSCPVGLVNSSVGGTEIESWMSKEALAKFPAVVRTGKKRDYLYESYPERYDLFLKQNRAWEDKYKRTDDLPPLPPADAVWRTAKPPVAFGNGIYFLRTKVNISAGDAAKGFRINLMRTYSPMALYIDGKRFAVRDDAVAYKLGYFTCNIPKGKLAAGEHEVILRYFVSHDRVRLPRTVYFGNTVVTEKQWEIFCGKEFGKPSGESLKERPRQPGMLPSRNRLWSRLYNGMIHPLIPFCFSGVIWYQGESNANDAASYRKLFPAMINDWRMRFGGRKLPFFFCQLASYYNKSADPADCGKWPLLRDAQRAALEMPDTGMVVLTDAGEALDIHPIDKKTPGSRLAALALKQLKSRDIAASGPVARRAVAAGGKVTVEFADCSGGLKARKVPENYPLRRIGGQYRKLVRNSPEAQVEGFALCGKEGKWFWADKAEIIGNSVSVSSAKVPVPVKIRFGWMNNPECNLYNGAGFPAVPFELPVR